MPASLALVCVAAAGSVYLGTDRPSGSESSPARRLRLGQLLERGREQLLQPLKQHPTLPPSLLRLSSEQPPADVAQAWRHLRQRTQGQASHSLAPCVAEVDRSLGTDAALKADRRRRLWGRRRVGSAQVISAATRLEAQRLVRELSAFPSRGSGAELQLLDAKTAKKAKKRVLILISDTGGGHRASAQALEAAMAQVSPGKVDVSIVDVWTQYGAWPFNTMVEGYRLAAKYPQLLWRPCYFLTSCPPIMACLNLQMRLSCSQGFGECMRDHDPHMVVSMHPLTQHVPLHVLQHMGGGERKVPFSTVVTDLGSAHPTWFDKRVDACFVPSDAVRKVGQRCGLLASQLRQHGLPVRPSFWTGGHNRADLAAELNLDAHRKTVLIVGGGDGVGSLEAIVGEVATEAARRVPDQAQIVVVCGKNARLEAKLGGKQWHGVDVRVRGFISRMSDYMEVSDCIVTKAGPGTIAEAAIRGLPTMLSSFLPGQEAGNVPFVTESGFGEYSARPRKIATTVTGWLQDECKMDAMSEAAAKAGQPHTTGTTAIASDLLGVLDGTRISLLESERLLQISSRAEQTGIAVAS